MSDNFVLVLTAVLALGTLGGSLWSIWRITRRTPSRERGLSEVMGSIAGTVLLGVVLPAMLKGMVDPFPVWSAFAVVTLVAATVLGWRWDKLERARADTPRLVISSVVLLLALAAAGVAVT